MPRSAAASPEDLLVPCPRCAGTGTVGPPAAPTGCPLYKASGRTTRRRAEAWTAKHPA